MGKAFDYSEKQVLEAINECRGIVSVVARRLGCSWNTAKEYIQLRSSTVQAMQDEEEMILDLCESTIYRSIKDGDTHSAKWVLATKGKRRGFSEKDTPDYSAQIAEMQRIFQEFLNAD